MFSEIQDALIRERLDGWLFVDHHRRDPLAYKILGLDATSVPSRRWYYFIPAAGSPRKLVHKVEAQAIDQLPGHKDVYSGWLIQQQKLATLVGGAHKVAMQYSPNCAIPYVANVDGGTLELVKACGVEIVSSANLVQEFEARWSADQLETHLEAGRKVDSIRREAFSFVRKHLENRLDVSEYDVQQFILKRFAAAELMTDHGPIVAVNENASDPHYTPTTRRRRMIRTEDVLLIDLWAKGSRPGAVYYDVTWVGFCGSNIPSKVQNVFEVVRAARKAASDLVIDQVGREREIYGWQVDDAARGLITKHGLDSYFFHRTGHSIGTEVHGYGANMDNYESHDERRIIPNTCFSIEPGVYLPEFGIRSEVNVYVEAKKAWVTGEEQDAVVSILG